MAVSLNVMIYITVWYNLIYDQKEREDIKSPLKRTYG